MNKVRVNCVNGCQDHSLVKLRDSDLEVVFNISLKEFKRLDYFVLGKITKILFSKAKLYDCNSTYEAVFTIIFLLIATSLVLLL